jgi:hypothetical protein
MRASRTLFILDSVAAARALLAMMPAGDGGAEMLSTHYSVVGFLAARRIPCRDFSDFISVEQASAAIRGASTELDAVLARLDETVGARMCAAAGLPQMALFHASLKYLGQYHLAGLACFERILTSRLAQGDIWTVHFLHALDTADDPVFSFVATAERVCKQYGVEYSEVPVRRSAAFALLGGIHRLYALARRGLRAPDRTLAVLTRRLWRWLVSHVPGASPIVLLLDPDYESFFEATLSGRGVRLICVPRNGIVRGSGIAVDAAQATCERLVTAATEWLQMQASGVKFGLDGRIVSWVIENAESLLLPLSHAHLLLRSQAVSAAAWDVPLITRPQLNVLAELLLCSGVPVLGRQHGANYVDQNLGTIHFDSDFNRCTHFFSYGFGSQEFVATYPMAKARCAFIPAGNPPLEVERRQRSVDIVFPVTGCCSLYELARVPESELTGRQSRILQAMEAREDLKCVVKPPPQFGEDDFAHLETLRRLRHVRVARATWTEYLVRCRPRLVVFEIASTPLFEALPLDVDIFLMLDPIFPFAKSALAMLKQRVHIFAAAEELAEAIGRYGIEPLPRLRDQTYYSAYVNRGSPTAALELLTTQIFTLDHRPPV